MSTLQMKNVKYKYDKTTKFVLNDINMDFEPGKLYCIMGKSGEGKSTILSLISGLDICTSGDIIYNGKDLRSLDRDEYRSKDIGVIFQGLNLITNATAVENIVLSMNISGSKIKNKEKFALEILDKVGINIETANRKVLKLSGGEQQRVGIARALSHNPDVVIADEPTANLDNETEENIMNIFRKLVVQEQKCVIIVTHSNEVSKYADELWGLKKSKLMFIK